MARRSRHVMYAALTDSGYQPHMGPSWTALMSKHNREVFSRSYRETRTVARQYADRSDQTVCVYKLTLGGMKKLDCFTGRTRRRKGKRVAVKKRRSGAQRKWRRRGADW